MNEKIKIIKDNFLKANIHWQKHWWQYSLGGLVLCLFFLAYAFRIIWLPEQALVPTVEETYFRHPLTGEKVAEEMTRPQVFGVMVENAADAQPLAGIEDAFLVIEAPVEANIPRLLAFYHDQQFVERIGPVRSARAYYLDWAEELDALYVHCGGSPEALKLIVQNGIFDLNEFWNGKYFWRSPSRFAPHNIYTSSDLLVKAATSAAASKEAHKPDYGLWSFKDDNPAGSSENADLIIENGLAYKIEWRYDLANNNYLRWQDGSEFKTEIGNSISADNVALIYTPLSVIDSIGRLDLETVGQGTAVVFQDGRVIDAVWKKEAADLRLRFYAEDGKEIFWNAGVTWIEVVSTAALRSEP